MKVSIIMLTYNHEKFIAQAIEGVLLQETDFPFELIVANDCSSDRTEEIIQTYRGKFPGIIKGYNNKRNLGPRYNFIKAYGKTTSEYIAMCEGDDYWTDPLKLQKQVDFLDCNPEYSLCAHNYKVINPLTKTDEFPLADLEKEFPDGFEITLNNFFSRWLTKTLSTVFRRNCIDFNLYDYKYLNDTILFFYLLKGKIGYWMNFNGGCYRVHHSNSWYLLTHIQKITISFKTLLELYKKNKKELLLQKALLEKNIILIENKLEYERTLRDLPSLIYYCFCFYRTNPDKPLVQKYFKEKVLKCLRLRLKIYIRRLFDKKFRETTNKYRSPIEPL